MAAVAQRNLDDLVMEALLSQRFTAADESDIAATTRFERASIPYEDVAVEVEPARPLRRRPRTFVRTVRARETDRDIEVPSLSPAAMIPSKERHRREGLFEAKWFDRSEDSLSRMLAAEQLRRKRQWLWLAISLIVATAATIALSM